MPSTAIRPVSTPSCGWRSPTCLRNSASAALCVSVWISGFATLASPYAILAAPQSRWSIGKLWRGVDVHRSSLWAWVTWPANAESIPRWPSAPGERCAGSRSPGPACVLPRISHLSSVSFARSCCRFLRDLVEFKSLRRIATCLMRPRGIASAIPACPARSASVRCIDVRTEAECNAFARGSRRLVAGERGYSPAWQDAGSIKGIAGSRQPAGRRWTERNENVRRNQREPS